MNEERYWGDVAALAGIERHAVFAALGVTIARGEEHTELWRHLGVAAPAEVGDIAYTLADLYPDALPCLAALRGRGFRVGLAGNQSYALEQWSREADLPVDVIGSSASWQVRNPRPRSSTEW